MALREVTNTKSRASGSKVTSNCALTSYQEDEDIQKIDAHLHFGDDLIFCCIGTPAVNDGNNVWLSLRAIDKYLFSIKQMRHSKILLANAILWSQTPLNAELSHLFNDTQAKFTDFPTESTSAYARSQRLYSRDEEDDLGFGWKQAYTHVQREERRKEAFVKLPSQGLYISFVGSHSMNVIGCCPAKIRQESPAGPATRRLLAVLSFARTPQTSISVPRRLQPRRLSFLIILPPHAVPMRRSFKDLQQYYDMRKLRGISSADGHGYLYAYVDNHTWKVGMTNDFVRRQEEWDKDCPCPWRIWLPPIRVANRRRAETLAHLLLEMECLDRPRIYCQSCQRVHIEKFVFPGPWNVVWNITVHPIFLRAAVS
ncbi:hypothetical protein F5877DRAFT_65607 [Lentinula edodes]|nr:hypothetical protein F5877DRAFT_65607 [Lentinula edodes]